MQTRSPAAFGFLKLIALFLWELVNAYPIETVPTWILNPKDQVAVSLVDMFRTNKDYKEREFIMLSNTTKVTSREAFFIKEFRPACYYMSNKDRSAPFGTANPLLIICNKVEVHELTIDKATGRVTATEAIFTAPAEQVCKSVDWGKDINTYAVFCYNAKEGSTGFYYVYLIDGATKKLAGSKNYDAAGLRGYNFSERVTVAAVKVAKGGLESDTIFAIYDEPYPDFDLNIFPKNNHFVIIVDVEMATKKPKTLQVLNLQDQTDLVPTTFQKFLSFQFINTKLYFAWFTNTYLPKFGRCDVNTVAGAAVKLEKCTILKADVLFRYGTLAFLPSGMVGIFNKHDLKYSVCNFDENNPTNILQNCRNIAGRLDSDVTVENFESYLNTQLSITYRNKDKSKHIGVDRFTVTATQVDVLNKFKTLCDVSRESNGRYYTSVDSFIDAFDDNRTEEMILQAAVLFPDKWHKIQVQMIHQKVTKLENYTYYRLGRSVDKIGLAVPGGFPKLMGYFQKLFRIPLGREYFYGNAIQFQFSAPNVKTVVSNAGPAKVVMPGAINKFVNTFYAASGLQVLSLDEFGKKEIVNCGWKIDTETTLECSTVGGGGGTNIDSNEAIIGMFETQQLLMIVTNKSRAFGYDKVRETGGNINFGTGTASSVSFKVRDSVIQIALLGTDTKGASIIQIWEWNQYNLNSISTKFNITSYAADPAQETAGDFCPKSVSYEIEDYPVLVVLNSCPTKDRRLIRFNITDPTKLIQVSNRFIRVPEFKQENLIVCPDLESIIVAAPGTKAAMGIGYDTYNMIQDLSLEELNVKEIKKMVCLNEKAFGVGFVDNNNVFKIATFYTNKMRLADRKLHSVIDFAELPDYRDFVGSEGNDIVYYNVYSTVTGKKSLKAVYLDGPWLFLQSDTRMMVNDAMVNAQNGFVTENFNLMISLIEQKTLVTVESRTSKVALQKRTYNMEELSIFKGPVFTIDYDTFKSNSVVSLTPRIESPVEFIDPTEADGQGYLFATKITDIGTTIDIVFTLIQKQDSSLIHVRHMNGGTNVTKTIDQRCHQIKVLDSEEGYQVFLSCLWKSEFRFFFYLINKSNGDILRKRYSDIRSRATILEVAPTLDPNRHIIGTIDDQGTLFLWDMNTAAGPGLDGQGKSDTIHVYNQTNVKNARIIYSAKRINVLYFKASDSKANLIVVNPASRIVDRLEGFLIVVTTDETTIANFACRLQDGQSGQITCIFATNGPLIHKILFDENIAAGFVQREKSSYYLYDDNYVIKTDFNKEFIVVLARSPATGKTNLLIYRTIDNFGSVYLWSGIKLEDHTPRATVDIDMTFLENHRLLLTTNSKLGSSQRSLVKSFQLRNATLELKVPEIEALSKQEKLKINIGAVGQGSVPLHHFFLTLDEQNASAFRGASQWYHWVLMGLFFLAVYAVLAFQWHREKLRHAKLKEDALHNNIAVEAEF